MSCQALASEGLKSGNIAETRRKYEIAPNLYDRWEDEVEQGTQLRLGKELSCVPKRRTDTEVLEEQLQPKLKHSG